MPIFVVVVVFLDGFGSDDGDGGGGDGWRARIHDFDLRPLPALLAPFQSAKVTERNDIYPRKKTSRKETKNGRYIAEEQLPFRFLLLLTRLLF